MKHSSTLYISLTVFLAIGGVAFAEDTDSKTREANKTIGNGSPAASADVPDGSVLEANKIIGNGSPIAASETASHGDDKIIVDEATAASGQ